MSEAKQRDPFVSAVKATLGVAVTVVVLAVLAYAVLKPSADTMNRITYGWSDADKAAYHTAASAAHDDCMADQYAQQKITYQDFRAGRATREALTAAIIACANVK